MDRDLFLSILSLDAYHRGYNPGLYLENLNVNLSAIGNAQIDAARGQPDADAIGFFAQSYLWNGEKVISYRGTDNNIINPVGLDQINGYGISLGDPGGPQALMALEFYNAVDAANAGNIVLTGQSLGGGLAGYVRSRSTS